MCWKGWASYESAIRMCMELKGIIRHFFPVFSVAIILVCTYHQIGAKAYSFDNKKILTISENGAWCWFQDPRAIYVEGRYRKTYAGWITNNGILQVGSYDHDTGRIERVSIKDNWDADDHNVNSFLVLPDRRIMIFYTRHNKPGIFSKTTLKPEDIGAWSHEITISTSAGITYSHPVYLSSEKRYYLFWRGPSWKPTFSTSQDGKNWAIPRILIQQKGREDPRIRPYLKVFSDGISTIHFAFTDGHPSDEPHNSLYYLRYQKGHFYKADGAVVGTMDSLPIHYNKYDFVYDAKVAGSRAWLWDIAADKAGYPVIVYTVFPHPTDHRYRYARWDGHRWFDTEITPAGGWLPRTQQGDVEREPYYSGGVALNHADPSIVFLSRRIKNVFKIEKWTTGNGGKNWHSKLITRGSVQDSFRPIIPYGYNKPKDHVLWVQGHYMHFTDFATQIHMLVPSGY